MTEPTFQTLQVNGIRMRVAEQGSGPLVLFCHGWPESWYSWRHQLAALAAAGYRAVAPDMRGYGSTDAPAEIEQYTLLHLVGDMVDLVQQLGETSAVVVGHDWGAPVAWHAALLRPDLFPAVVGMSVPFTPPARTDLLTSLEKLGIHTFYMQYFQTPGVAEAEFERDIEASVRRIQFSASGDAPEKATFGVVDPARGYLGGTIDPETLPVWLTPEDVAHYAGEFRRAGFRGGLNWYRNLRRNAGLLAPWRGCVIRQPSMFIAGARDGVMKFPASKKQIDDFPRTLPGIRGCHILEGAGHWVQRERAAQVNALLLEFLRGL
ncbi:MAG TPA: alpha/beta hydrolase [Quisquiliibacterium sp.]|nr:MAG: alpha/beta hydrolase [Burkholderiaceae bacterium]HOA94748.1 alpha/beta hydrolase [Quisquiliibacterium sp.]HPA91915.1 alpha/beta hydrolase [Quisquiliibacterium sp.]HQN14389.1 alpha/beta hydrolase [Quisquiliibacterium sp.]HQP68290.1 alpha/beta hydrolase [Quisquiliibacterium sp.]